MTSNPVDGNRVDCDLAIVGGGIAGPALAAALADHSYRIVLIERSAEPLDTARGDHLQPAACAWLERWGVLDMLFKRGAERRCGARWQTPDGQLVLNVSVDDLDIPHPYFLYLNHELISEVLLGKASANPGFSILRPATAHVVRDADAPGQHGLLVNHAGGQVHVNAHCIVIADGRASPGRKALGIETRIHNYANPLLVLKIGFPLGREQLADWTDSTPEELARRLTQMVPLLDGIKPQVAGVYPVAMVNAARWADGNCVLLGDACHALHPGRSQGMNVALRGVSMLAALLGSSDFPRSPPAVPRLLSDFEAQHKGPIDARLEANHARGLEMDQLDTAGVERTRKALSEVAASKENTHGYCMRAAGY
jgi:2-polyprenyl-6-methoxyphenol hydroxylase-like FAD-dependent oxidoreductase